MTLGVHHRVEQLKDREAASVSARKIPFKSIVPLAEILAEVYGVKSNQSTKVDQEYMRLTDTIANEFSLLLDVPIETIAKQASNPNLAIAIDRMRRGEVRVTPGYDGIYGKVSLVDGSKRQKQTQLL